MDILGVAALTLSFLLWLFNPHPVRRWLGLLPPPEPEPLYVAGAQLANHPIVGPILSKHAGALTWILLSMERSKLAEGYTRYKLENGQAVIRQAPEAGQVKEMVLMWKSEAGGGTK